MARAEEIICWEGPALAGGRLHFRVVQPGGAAVAASSRRLDIREFIDGTDGGFTGYTRKGIRLTAVDARTLYEHLGKLLRDGVL